MPPKRTIESFLRLDQSKAVNKLETSNETATSEGGVWGEGGYQNVGEGQIKCNVQFYFQPPLFISHRRRCDIDLTGYL